MKRKLVVISALLIWSAGALADGTISNGGVEFSREFAGFQNFHVFTDLTGTSSTPATNHLHETGWWYRIDGDSKEQTFYYPSSEDYDGARSEIMWNDLNGRGLLSATEISYVHPQQGPSGYVEIELTLTNLTDAPLDVELFHMADFDVNPAEETDSAVGITDNLIRFTNPSGDLAGYFGGAADGYLVRDFEPASVWDVLNDADVDDFNNTGVPNGPGDLTAGFQFSLNLPAFGSDTVRVVLSVNSDLIIDSALDGEDCSVSQHSMEADGVCASCTGACTFRAALDEANAMPGNNTLRFALSGFGNQTLDSGDLPLDILDDTVINPLPLGSTDCSDGSDLTVGGNANPRFSVFTGATLSVPCRMGVGAGLEALSAGFSGISGNYSLYFDVEADGTGPGARIVGFSTNIDAGRHDVDIWTRPGTHVGNENTFIGWTRIFSGSGVSASGLGNKTILPSFDPISLSPGGRHAFLIITKNAPVLNYGNGSGTAGSTVDTEDGTLRIYEGSGQGTGTAFSGSLVSPKTFSGEIFYTPLPPP